MENINEQTPLTAQAADAEKESGATEEKGVSLGKFKDVNALLNAYNSLQSEFTKRCQRLKELEDKMTAEKTTASTESVEQASTAQVNAQNLNEREILQEYLKGVINAKQKAVVMDGGGTGVCSPVKKPSTIAEAGLLAKEILQ